MKKQQISIRTFWVALCIVALGTFGITYAFLYSGEKVVSVKNNNKVINMDYGSSFLKLKVKDASGKVLDQFPNEQKNQIVIYLSDTCKTCIEVLKNLNCVKNVFGSEKFSYVLLWKEHIPKKLIKQCNADLNSCYSLENTELATTTPTIYLLNSKGKVFFSNIDFQLIIEKIIEMNLVPKDDLIKKANEYIKQNFLQPNSDKVQLLYFTMEGCSDCEKANKVVSKKKIVKKFDVNPLYYKDDDKDNKLKDIYGIFCRIYGIEWYPSFIIFKNGEIKLIGETSLRNLEEKIMEQAN